MLGKKEGGGESTIYLTDISVVLKKDLPAVVFSPFTALFNKSILTKEHYFFNGSWLAKPAALAAVVGHVFLISLAEYGCTAEAQSDPGFGSSMDIRLRYCTAEA